MYPEATKNSAREPLLDVLRFASSLLVLLYHWIINHSIAIEFEGENYTWVTMYWPGHDHLKYGNLGVNIFFVISGYVIFRSAVDRSARDFVIQRVARLVPMYVLFTIPAIIIASTSMVRNFPATKPMGLETWLPSLTLSNFALGLPAAEGATWSLWVEVKFYALLAVLILVFKHIDRTRARVILLLWLTLTLVTADSGSKLLDTVLIRPYSMYFVLGGLLSVFASWRSRATMWLPIAVATTLVLVDVKREFETIAFPTLEPIVIMSIGILVIAISQRVRVNRVRVARLCEWLGAVSFPLYLAHQTTGEYIITVINRSGLDLRLSMLATFIVLMLWCHVAITYFDPALRDRIRRTLNDSWARISD